MLGFFVDAGTVHRFALSRLMARLRIEGPAARLAYTKPPAGQPANVVFVVVDSLRADHMSAYGYPRQTTPFLDDWVRQGKLQPVGRAFASCPESGCGISSLLASKTLGSLLPENFSLLDLLHDQGYDVNIIASGDHDWYGLKEFYGDVTRFVDGTTSRRYKPTDDRVVLEGLEAVPASATRPAFFYLHLMSVHALGIREDAFARFQPTRANAYWGNNEEERINGYDNGVVQADAILRQAFTTLGEKGYLKNAVVVITSDHGEGLVDRDGMRGLGHGQSLHRDYLQIPLFFGDSSGRPLPIREAWATHVDVAPTIVDRLGLPVPTVWEGQSLIGLNAHPDSFHYADRDDFPSGTQSLVNAGASCSVTVVQGRDRRLFSIAADLDEQRNLISTADPTLLRSLEQALDRVLAESEK